MCVVSALCVCVWVGVGVWYLSLSVVSQQPPTFLNRTSDPTLACNLSSRVGWPASEPEGPTFLSPLQFQSFVLFVCLFCFNVGPGHSGQVLVFARHASHSLSKHLPSLRGQSSWHARTPASSPLWSLAGVLCGTELPRKWRCSTTRLELRSTKITPIRRTLIAKAHAWEACPLP